jgi:hypothetical protein
VSSGHRKCRHVVYGFHLHGGDLHVAPAYHPERQIFTTCPWLGRQATQLLRETAEQR